MWKGEDRKCTGCWSEWFNIQVWKPEAFLWGLHLCGSLEALLGEGQRLQRTELAWPTGLSCCSPLIAFHSQFVKMIDNSLKYLPSEEDIDTPRAESLRLMWWRAYIPVTELRRTGAIGTFLILLKLPGCLSWCYAPLMWVPNTENL